jgi:hypothetical protein
MLKLSRLLYWGVYDNFQEFYKFLLAIFFLYGLETWSLTLREEHRLRVVEHKVLRIIFGPKRDEMTGGWRKLHNEGFYDFYSSRSIIIMTKLRRMRRVRNVAYRILVEKPEEKRAH